MENEERTTWITISIIAAIFLTLVVWATGYENGYFQGHRVSRAYYEATGKMPSPRWIEGRPFHADTKWRILELLEKEADE